jgi:hypothetical protein
MRVPEIDRRFIYLFVFLALALPLLVKKSVPPARMSSAERIFELVEKADIKNPDIAFVAMDYGPNLVAENGAQAEVALEHLMRRRIPFAVFSLYVQAEPFLEDVPARIAGRLMNEMPGQEWKYGVDWVNLGYRPGQYLVVQGIPKSQNLVEFFKNDARGNSLAELPAFRGVRTIENIKMLFEFTGLVGMLDTYIAFFQKEGYRPIIAHGCTSITIPDSYTYLDAGQLNGVFEGIAGAAWYSKLMTDLHSERTPDDAVLINTGLGVAHLLVILLIVLGNLGSFVSGFGGDRR